MLQLVKETKNNPWTYAANELHIPIKVRKELRERSIGVCERCYNELATDATPSIRRWEITGDIAVHDLVHLCQGCANYCETSHAGRIFLVQFRKLRMEEMK